MHDLIENSIQQKLPDAVVETVVNGNHIRLSVTSKEFEGKGLLAKQRLVYSAIAPLMEGHNAMIHAVDHLETKTPA